MAAVRGSDTKPEMVLRKGLHARGFRFRLHDRKLPGRPDIILPKYRALVFAHGCFWHGHQCSLFRWPATRQQFWQEKIGGNVLRDQRNVTALSDAGWRIGIVWECSLKGTGRLTPDELFFRLTGWLKSDDAKLEIRGSTPQG